MSNAKPIDGNQIAAKVLEEVKVEATKFKQKQGRQPGLAVVLVGEDPGSAVYVRMKIRDCGLCGDRVLFPSPSRRDAHTGAVGTG